jgi:hypothetical protein
MLRPTARRRLGMGEELSMSSGKPGPDPHLLHPTRQMLDELDALMERMLALPISDAEESAHPQTSSVAVEHAASTPPMQPLTAKLTLLPVPTEEPPLDGPHAGTNPSHLPAIGVIRSSGDALRLPPLPEEPMVEPEPLAGHVLPPPLVPTSEALQSEVPEPPTTYSSWFILPVLWGNRLFDLGTWLLGEPGSWLRSPAGRGVLGLAGLVLLAVACIWMMRDWLGWTW